MPAAAKSSIAPVPILRARELSPFQPHPNHRCPFRGNRWPLQMIKPPVNQGHLFSCKTTKKDTYDPNPARCITHASSFACHMTRHPPYPTAKHLPTPHPRAIDRLQVSLLSCSGSFPLSATWISTKQKAWNATRAVSPRRHGGRDLIIVQQLVQELLSLTHSAREPVQT